MSKPRPPRGIKTDSAQLTLTQAAREYGIQLRTLREDIRTRRLYADTQTPRVTYVSRRDLELLYGTPATATLAELEPLIVSLVDARVKELMQNVRVSIGG